MSTQQLDESLRSGLTLAAGLSAVWLIAAAIRPTATYHLAPILIAGAIPFFARGAGRARSALAGATAIGSLVAILAAVALAALDLLRGPSLLPVGGALAEAITFAVVGGAIGLVVVLASPRLAG